LKTNTGNQKYQMQLLAFFFIVHSNAQECKPATLPDLPLAFVTNLQYNVGSKDRYALRTCALDNSSCQKHPDSRFPPPHQMGQSYTIEEAIEGKISSLEIVSEFTKEGSESGEQQLMVNSFLWNPFISGVENFIMTTVYGYPESETTCLVDDVYDQSQLDWLFGFNPSCRPGNATSPDCTQPSVAGMLHTAGNYTFDSCQTTRGIATNLFTTHWSIPEWQAEIDVRYYWSNTDLWQSSSGTGKSVPIRCELEGHAVSPDTGLDIDIVETIDYQDFFEVPLGERSFLPEPYLVCAGRTMDRKLQPIPDAVEYGSEVIFHWRNPMTDSLLRIVTSRDNWYDHGMKLARTDYKPIDLNNPSDPLANREGVRTDIQDFVAGLSYQIDKFFGNCTVQLLAKDPNNLTINDMQMTDPLHLFHMDKQFAYNGEHLDRSIMMGFFAAEDPIKEGSYENMTTIVKMSSAGYLVEEDGQNGLLIPASVVQYPTADYNDITKWTTTNIYRFSRQLTDFQDYDITGCFEETHTMHLLVKMSWRMDEDLMAYKEVQRFARATISTRASITPLRVQNIELSVEASGGVFNLIFTLVDFPPNIGPEADLPEQARRPISECKQLLTQAVDSGNFFIEVHLNGGGTVRSQAVPKSLRELDSRSPHHDDGHPTVTYEQGYTSGDMAGLAIGMVFGGLLLAGVIYFFALRNNVRAGIPVMRGLENPLTGLSNLGTTLTSLGKT